MSKAVTGGIGMATAMARDAFGNLLSGNDERAMRFIIELIKTLEATEALSASKNGIKENTALDALARGHVAIEDTWPKFSGVNLQASFAKWEALGITSGMALKPVGQ